MTACGIQNPRVVLAPPPTTLLRGRTEPEDEGRAEGETLLLLDGEEVEALPEDLVVVVGLLPDDGLPPDDGLAAVDGLPLEDGLEFVDGVEGLSDAGGTLACATGAPPPPERL